MLGRFPFRFARDGHRVASNESAEEVYFDCSEEVPAIDRLKALVEEDEVAITGWIRGIEGNVYYLQTQAALSAKILRQTIQVLNNSFNLAKEISTSLEMSLSVSPASRISLLFKLSDVVLVLHRNNKALQDLESFPLAALEAFAGNVDALPGDLPPVDSAEVLSHCLRALKTASLSASEVLKVFPLLGA